MINFSSYVNKKIQYLNTKPLFKDLPHPILLIVFYTIAHGGIFFFPNAIFWDDWTLWNHSAEDIISTFEQAGAFFNITGYMHSGLLYLGPWAYTILTFTAPLIVAVLLNDILAQHRIFTKDVRFTLLILLLATPLYSARVALIMLPSTLSVLMFVLAWWLIDKKRLLSLTLFVACFNVQSLLVFYALPILEWYFRTHKHIKLVDGIVWALPRIDYVLLPFIWFGIKITYFASYGFYANYNNSYSFERFISAATRQWDDLTQLSFSYLLFGVFALLSYVALRKKSLSQNAWMDSLRLCLIGFLILLLALIPYWVLGHAPTFTEWTSRHQLLMPFGIALIFTALIMRCPYRMRIVSLVVILAAFLSKNSENYWMFWKDAQKQDQIISFLQNLDIEKNPSLVVFDDKTDNALSRSYRFYEWNGIMRASLGTQSHFGITPNEVAGYNSGRLDKYFDEKYNARDHVRNDDQERFLIVIDEGKRGITITAKPL